MMDKSFIKMMLCNALKGAAMFVQHITKTTPYQAEPKKEMSVLEKQAPWRGIKLVDRNNMDCEKAIQRKACKSHAKNVCTCVRRHGGER